MSLLPSEDAFAQMAALPDGEIDLGRASLLLGADETPGLDVACYLKRLDMLAAGVAERMPRGASPDKQVEVLVDYLFHQRRFRGNADNYYDPRNSYLNEVIDRRLGIPISLSVVAIEVGRRAGVPLRGVGLPGHFVVRHATPGVELFMDPFHGGRVLSAMDCHELAIQALGGTSFSFGHFLEPVSSRAILTRMLANLKLIYFRQGDVERATRVLDRMLQLHPGSPEELRERGLLHATALRYRAALSDLTAYLQARPDAPDVELIHQQIELIWTALKSQ